MTPLATVLALSA
jgi:hypothetical protein